MKKINTSLVSIAALAILGACATARVVSSQPGKGGVIAVAPANSPEARQKADAIMARNCGEKKVEVVEEGETVVGQTTRSNGSADVVGKSLFSSGTSTTSQETEWRVTYKCN